MDETPDPLLDAETDARACLAAAARLESLEADLETMRAALARALEERDQAREEGFRAGVEAAAKVNERALVLGVSKAEWRHTTARIRSLSPPTPAEQTTNSRGE